MKNAAIDSIIDWAQNNRHYETMQVRVVDVLDFIYGKEPTKFTPIDISIFTANRCGVAQGLLLSVYDKIPEDRFWEAMHTMVEIANPKKEQPVSHKSNQPKTK